MVKRLEFNVFRTFEPFLGVIYAQNKINQHTRGVLSTSGSKNTLRVGDLPL